MAITRGHRVDRRTFIEAAAAGAAGLAASRVLPGVAADGTVGARRPNVLFILSDQQRWDTVDCYGTPIFPGLTPNLDSLASTGVRFQHAFTPQPVCAPARAVMQTGRYATETGVVRNTIPLDPGEKTLAHWLGAAGYNTGYIGKWHLGARGSETDPALRYAVPPPYQGGYQHWLASNALEMTSHAYDGFMFDGKMQRVDFPPDRYRADCVTDYALDFLRAQSGTQPFFLFVSYIEPHHQNDHNHFEGPRGSKERFKHFRVPPDLTDTPLPGDWRDEMPDYLGCCNNLDENVGRLRKQLAQMGAADNTLIIYTSDHACHFRTHEGEYKRSCHDNSLRVPMIVSGPGFSGGKVVQNLVSLVDLPPTVVSAAGVAPPPTMRGRALQGLASGTARDWPEEIFVQISEAGIGRAVRTKKWVYAVEAPAATATNSGTPPTTKAPPAGSSDVYIEKYLFNLETDPVQRRNLIADPRWAQVRAEMGSRLKRLMSQAGEAAPEIRPAPTISAQPAR